MDSFNFDKMATEELLAQAERIAKILHERDEDSKKNLSFEKLEQIEILSSLFKLDEQEKIFFLEIGTYKSSFYTEWHTPQKSVYKGYRILFPEKGFPEESLLERAPVKWLENLLLGVYETSMECY